MYLVRKRIFNPLSNISFIIVNSNNIKTHNLQHYDIIFYYLPTRIICSRFYCLFFIIIHFPFSLILF